MGSIPLDFHAICRSTADGVVFGSPLMMPEVSGIGRDEERVVAQLQRLAARHLAEMEPLERHRRIVGGAPAVHVLHLVLEPPADQSAWRTPVEWELPYVRWEHQGRQAALFVPALDVMLVVREDKAESELRTEVLATLKRRGASVSLAEIERLRRSSDVILRTFRASVDVLDPKRWAQRDAGRGEAVLPKVATRLGDGLRPAFEIDATVDRLAEALTGRRPRSVLLVGPSGVGKSAAFRELVRTAARRGLAHREFWSTDGARLMAGAVGFGGWQDRCRALCFETAKRECIVHLGRLAELIEVGRCGGSSGVGEFLRPSLERGELLAVAECTPEEQSAAARDHPGLVEAFRPLVLSEPHGTVRSILEHEARRLERRTGTKFEGEALAELERLHRRYATGSVVPGRALRFLRNLAGDRRRTGTGRPEAGTDAVAATRRDVIAAFSRETGLPLVLLDPEVPMDPTAVAGWLGARVAGQPEAVRLVVDLLATVKARLARPGRPLASLLFIGPTGVGKTEMAKAIAEFFFRDRARMVRVDAGEYGHPASVGRLTGATGEGEGLLTARVRDQPFGVVLIDEFEKAAPSFHDLLLQVLGEGRLTDAAGRTADFRNCIVVMTSNLGADAVRRGTVGFDRSDADAATIRERFRREVQSFLRPEMFNRIDAVVPFAPLDDGTLRRIVQDELRRLELRDGLRARRLSLALDEATVDRLAALGTEPLYGARPLKRAIERHLLVPLAEQLNRHSAEERLSVAASAALTPGNSDAARPAAGPIDVRVRAVPDDRDDRAAGRSRSRIAEDCAVLRRGLYRADASAATLDLRNELFRLTRAEAKWLKSMHRRPDRTLPFDPRVAARLARLRRLDRALRDVLAEVARLEDDVLTTIYASDAPSAAGTRDPRTPAVSVLPADEKVGALDPESGSDAEPTRVDGGVRAEIEAVDVWPRLAERLSGCGTQWEALLFDLFEFLSGKDEDKSVLLAVYGDSVEASRAAAELYRDVALRQSFDVRAWALCSCRGDYDRALPKTAVRVGETDEDRRRRAADAATGRRTPRASDTTILEAHQTPLDSLHAGLEHDPVGFLLFVRGRLARTFFADEIGLHVRRRPAANPWRWIVDVSPAAEPTAYVPPQGIDRRDAFGTAVRRREYRDRESFRDDVLGEVALDGSPAEGLHGALVRRLRLEAEEAVVS